MQSTNGGFELSLVSIIVPIYNTEKYLAQCLESLLNQTLLPQKIVIVDDGSTDEESLCVLINIE